MPGTGTVFLQIARDAINTKRSQLTVPGGNPSSDVEAVDGGFESFVQHFDNGLDIYFTVGDGEAYEVHGDIKRKYDILSPVTNKALFGLPTTDESNAFDRGKFNDFGTDKSIYWHPDIGPRLVASRIRDSWKQQGAEGGSFGYPVKDLQRWPTPNPATDPPLLFSIFQNGGIAASSSDSQNALEATIDPDTLALVVHKQFDSRLREVDSTLGLDPQIKTITISGWSSGLIESSNRAITYRLSGFRSNPIIQDTTFVFDIGLRFRLQMEAVFGSPSTGSLLVDMVPGSLQVQAFGIGDASLQQQLQDGINATFKGPIVLTDQVQVSEDSGPILLDLLVTSTGGLSFLVNPLPPEVGRFRQLVVQRYIDETALPSLMK